MEDGVDHGIKQVRRYPKDGEEYGDTGYRVDEITVDGNPEDVVVDFVYPRSKFPNGFKMVVGVECVRSVDDVAITFDFDRDEWVFFRREYRNRVIEAGDKHTVCDTESRWVEVFSSPSWHQEPEDIDSSMEFPSERTG